MRVSVLMHGEDTMTTNTAARIVKHKTDCDYTTVRLSTVTSKNQEPAASMKASDTVIRTASTHPLFSVVHLLPVKIRGNVLIAQ